MDERRKRLIEIIRNAVTLLDYDLTDEQVGELNGVLDTLDRLIVSAYKEASHD